MRVTRNVIKKTYSELYQEDSKWCDVLNPQMILSVGLLKTEKKIGSHYYADIFENRPENSCIQLSFSIESDKDYVYINNNSESNFSFGKIPSYISYISMEDAYGEVEATQGYMSYYNYELAMEEVKEKNPFVYAHYYYATPKLELSKSHQVVRVYSMNEIDDLNKSLKLIL